MRSSASGLHMGARRNTTEYLRTSLVSGSSSVAVFDPSRGRPQIPHPGSHNANPISLVAGATTLKLLTDKAIRLLNLRGESLRQQIRTAFADAGLPAQVTGLGSLFAIHLTSQSVKSYRDTMHADA